MAINREKKVTYVTSPKDTDLSKQHADQANLAAREESLFAINPNTTIGQKLLLSKVESGEITSDFYEYLLSASPDERKLYREHANKRYSSAIKQSEESKVQPSTTSDSSSRYVKTASQSTTILTDSVQESRIVTKLIDGISYQVKKSGDTLSYTNTVSGETFIDSVDVRLQRLPYQEQLLSGLSQTVIPNKSLSTSTEEEITAKKVNVNKSLSTSTEEKITAKKVSVNNSLSTTVESQISEDSGFTVASLDPHTINEPRLVFKQPNTFLRNSQQIQDSTKTQTSAAAFGTNASPVSDEGFAAEFNQEYVNPTEFFDQQPDFFVAQTGPNTVNEPRLAFRESSIFITDAPQLTSETQSSTNSLSPVGLVIPSPYPDAVGDNGFVSASRPTVASDSMATTISNSPGFSNPETTSQTSSYIDGLRKTRSDTVVENNVQFPANPDYRVRISLSKNANYLYATAGENDILYPLKNTNGVIFPYTPTLTVSHNANYAPTDLVHANYKAYNYTGSSVDSFQITGDFTAQDTYEANYLLATIHFFKSVTKMFYGKDDNPIRGMPPPLVYLSGYGAYGYDNHPMVVTNFTLSYPNDVDYIRAQPGGITNQQLAAYKTPSYNTSTPGVTRMAISNLINKIFKFGNGNVLTSASKSFTSSSSMGDSGSSYTMIPTKMQISISCQPMATRRAISNKFSLHDYATGSLLQGSKNKTNGGGIW